MSLALLIPLSLVMGALGLAAFFWALRHQQFEDLDGAAWRVLMTGDASGPGSPPAPAEAERIEIEDGHFIVDAAVIARAFRIPVETTRDLMRDGTITSRTERGEESDAGRHRLTFLYQGRVFRLVVDDQGRILQRMSFDQRPPGSGAAPGR